MHYVHYSAQERSLMTNIKRLKSFMWFILSSILGNVPKLLCNIARSPLTDKMLLIISIFR